MRSAFRDVALVLFGVLMGLIGGQQPTLAPLLALALAAFVLLYVGSGWRPVRRRVAILRTPEDEKERLRVLLAGHLGTGNALISEVAVLKADLDRLADVEKRAVAWANAVIHDLDRHRPGWGELFMDDIYMGVQFGSQYGERDKIRNWLERRLAKLGELVRLL